MKEEKESKKEIDRKGGGKYRERIKAVKKYTSYKNTFRLLAKMRKLALIKERETKVKKDMGEGRGDREGIQREKSIGKWHDGER